MSTIFFMMPHRFEKWEMGKFVAINHGSIFISKEKMTNLQRVKDLHLNYVNAGRILEGFEKFYAENVIMQELGEEPRVGKAANRSYEIDFLSSVKEFHGGDILSFAEDTERNKTMVESWMELTLDNGHRLKMQQVAVQTWDNGLIVHELFYHK